MADMIVFYLITTILVGGSYGLVPFIVPDTLQFGVRIPPAHVQSFSIAKVRKTYYWIWLSLMIIVLGSGIGLATLSPHTWSNSSTALFVVLGSLVLHYGNYVLARRSLLRAKERESWYQGYTQSVVADTNMHTSIHMPSLLWALPDVFVAVVGILVPVVRYSAIPEKIPVHFTLAGVPDGFAVKSLWSVFGGEVMQIMLLIALLLVHANLHRFAARLDPANLDASKRRYDVLMNQGIKALWILLALINAGTVLMLLSIWNVASQYHRSFGVFGIIVIFVSVLFCAVWITRAAQTGRHLDEGAQSSRRVARDDDRFWLGGVLYFNPADAAILVPKRFGVGLTFNFGHYIAWVILLCIVGIPLVIKAIYG